MNARISSEMEKSTESQKMGERETRLNKRRPHLCLIYAGGTIGMIRKRRGDEEVLVPPKINSKEQFFRHLRAEHEASEIADVDFVALTPKDSTNMVPSDWTCMANAINKRLKNGYDGFVIAHGTDTLHFSASALAFAFGTNLNVPIVLTGAQATPDVPHGDARVNLLRAMKVASHENLAEVVVAFGDFVFRGCRAQKKDERRFDAFEAPAEFPLGYITEEIIISDRARRRKANAKEVEFHPNFCNGIVQISLIPGLEPDLLYPILEKNSAINGIVLQSFGAGNVPNEDAGKRFNFQAFIRRAVEQDIPVIVASQFPANSTLASYYAPGRDAVRAGAIPTGNMTNAAATVKFRWVLHQVNEQIRTGVLRKSEKLKRVSSMMNTPYVEELTLLAEELTVLKKRENRRGGTNHN